MEDDKKGFIHRISEVSAMAQNLILSERSVYMGLAILMVVTYHLTSRFHIPVLGHIFNFFSGVDIFIFFSGLGLCFSCTKNSLSLFYKNRFLRILPLYLVLAITSSIAYQITEGSFSVWDYFCNLTTLSYYGLGGCFVDWYLSSLLIFYLFFPFVFKNVKGGGYFAHLYNKRSISLACAYVLDLRLLRFTNRSVFVGYSVLPQ